LSVPINLKLKTKPIVDDSSFHLSFHTNITDQIVASLLKKTFNISAQRNHKAHKGRLTTYYLTLWIFCLIYGVVLNNFFLAALRRTE
jgi:hypothetical protein